MQQLERRHLHHPERMTPVEEGITVAVTTWLVLGIFLDGWAHNSGTLVESFFTPWHAALYSGFAASAGWIAHSVRRRRAAGVAWRDAVPAGYGLAVAGVIIFMVSGAGDLAWHLTFGIEHGMAALSSPTHLGLFVGALLIITAPLRAAWADAGGNEHERLALRLPAAGSATLAGCLTIFILQEFAQLRQNGFVTVGTALDISFVRPITELTSDFNVEAGIAAFVVGSLTLFVPLLLLARRFALTVPMVATVMGVQVVLLQGLQGFDDPGLVVLGIAGTAAVCLVARVLRPAPSRRPQLLVFAGVAAPLFWGVFLLGVDVHDRGLGWKPELWGGGLVWSALTVVGVALALTAPVIHVHRSARWVR